jgi:hypothetical protein
MLDKPYDPPALAALLREVLASNPAPRPRAARRVG